MKKKCIKCGIYKEENLFKINNDKYLKICKVCSNEQARYRASNTKIQYSGTKQCQDCGEIYDINEFGIDKLYNDGRIPRCHICQTKYRQKIKEKNKQEMNMSFWNRKATDANSRYDNKEKITGEELSNLYNNMKSKTCYYCGVSLTGANLHVDHNIPKVIGGRNLISNISYICSDCNLLKFIKTESEFKQFLVEYIDTLSKFIY